MGTILVAAALFGTLGYTVFHMIRSRKKGSACIGCPNCGSCAGCSLKKPAPEKRNAAR